MKKLAIISAIMMGGLIYHTAYAQVGVNIGFRLGNRPVYAPSANVAVEAPVYNESAPAGYYDNDDDYYYLPDVGAYYDVVDQLYYYNDGYNWVSGAYLPGYRDYDWRSARHFEIRARRPYLNNEFYSSKYGYGVRGGAVQYGHDAFAGRDAYRGSYPAEQHYDNRTWDGHAGNGQRYAPNGQYNGQPQNNRGYEGYGDRNAERQPSGFNQPVPERHEGGYGQPSNGGGQRGNMNNSQPAQQNRAPQNNAQPANNFGREGQNQHFANNRMHGGNERFGR